MTNRTATRERILILVENLSVPFDRRVWQESQALASEGYDVHVVCPRGENRDIEPYVTRDGVHIHRYPLRPATRGIVGYVREYGLALAHSARLVMHIGRQRRIGVVHACNPPDLFFLIALPLKMMGAKFVFDHHDLVPELYLSRFGKRRTLLFRVMKLLEWFTFRTADAVISTNESYRRIAIERGGMDPHAVTVVRSAPDLERFSQVEPDVRLRRGKRYLVCYLGVMGPQDGVDYALRAIAWLRHELRRTDFHTAFLGTGDMFYDLRTLAMRLDIDDCVEFTGRVPDETVKRYLSTADVCLAPDPKNPLNDVSTMNKIVEYMAMERPVVAFDLVEARVSAGDAALYARPNNEREFAGFVSDLLDNPARRAQMGAIGRKRVTERLSWDHSRARLIDAYERLIGSESAG